MRRMRGALELWVELRDGRPAVNPVMAALLRRLREGGAAVRVRVPETEVVTTEPDSPRRDRPDLVLLKSATSLALSRAVADERSGVRFLNPAATTLSVQDKAWVIARLASAGLPVPVSFLTAEPRLRRTPGDGTLGWIAKPVRGLHGAGVAAGSTPASALTAAALRPGAAWVVDDGTRLLQVRVGRPAEADLKVYVAGRATFAAWKDWAPNSHLRDPERSAALFGATRELVYRVGEVLGLTWYGVDLRLADGQTWIVDVNAFPGYRGFPEAVGVLSDEVFRALGAVAA